MKNLNELDKQDRDVSAIELFKGGIGIVTAINIKRNGTLKQHITKTPALLICVSGTINYEDENEQQFKLEQGDFVNILPNVKHWLYATVSSQLVLIK